MKIKKQFNLFIGAIISLPLLSILFIISFNKITSSERIFFKGYKRLQKMENISISKNDWSIIKNALKQVPKENQACFIAQNTVVISTFPELKENIKITENQLWEFIKLTSDKYYYQLETPHLKEENTSILLISRIDKDRHSKDKRYFSIFFSLLITFIIFCTVVIFIISGSITSSITILEEQTKKIADGELDVKIDFNPKKENEITNLSKNLEKMRKSLKEAQERRSRFVMGISHDLRTPIAVIKGYAEAMSDGILEKKQEQDEALEIILKKTSQLETMIDSLISYEKLSTDEWKAKMEDVNLKEFILSFVKTSESTANVFKRKIKHSMDIPKNLQVPMNRFLAQRAFDNIFSNALRYTNENDLITIKAEMNRSNAVISISDTGCGIEENDLKNIFDLFYRGTSSRREEGMGIGLSVVKNIMDIHNWKIEVKSKIKEGTTFSIYIPLRY